MHWIEKIYFYLRGRYWKFDQFSKFLMLLGFILLASATVFNISLLSYIGIASIAYSLLRPISKNLINRQKELAMYTKWKRELRGISDKVFGAFNRKFKRNKTHGRSKKAAAPTSNTMIIECPNCSQKLRAPSGKTLKITCQSCEYSFKQRT